MLWTEVLEKTLESPLDCKEIKSVNPKGNQSWIFIGRTDAEALQYFGHLIRRADSFEKTLMLVKTEGRRMDDRGWDALMASPTWWTFSNASSGSWWWTGKPGVLQSMGYQTQLSNWTELTMWSFHFFSSDHLTLFICKSFSLEKEMAPTPVSLPGKFHGWRSLADYSPWGCRESDMTNWLHFHFP